MKKEIDEAAKKLCSCVNFDEIKSKLDGLSRKDLLASISFSEEGIELLFKVFDNSRSRSETGEVIIQVASAEGFSLGKEVRNVELTSLDESTGRALFKAKKRCKDPQRKATEASTNEALETFDHILAIEYRVMATVPEKVDNHAESVEPCRACI